MMGAVNPAQSMQIMNEFNGLSAQIQSSLQVPVTYIQPTTYVQPGSVIANPVPGFYNNWRANLVQEEHNAALAHDLELARESRERAAERQGFNQQQRVNNVIQRDNLQQVEAAQRSNAQLNSLKTTEERAAYQRTHQTPVSH
jgi:hypothetical protein